MTKVLSQLLEAKEPNFRLGVQRLERVSGRPSQDIRMTSELQRATNAKLIELGLDPHDTLGVELYQALNQKLADSDKELQNALDLDQADPEFIEKLVDKIRTILDNYDCFTLKPAVAKRILKKQPPKRTMKSLHYRSMDSMLKREPLSNLYAGIEICESSSWQKQLHRSYKTLKPTDFKSRKLEISAPIGGHWDGVTNDYIASKRNNILSAREAGTISVLPMSAYPSGMVSAIFLLVLAEANKILTVSSYLELHQAQANFSELVVEGAKNLPTVGNPIDSQRLGWRVVHEYLASSGRDIDMQLMAGKAKLIHPEEELAKLSPRLGFWRGCSELGYLSDGDSISLNPVDVALNYLNGFDFERRLTNHFQQALWSRLWQSYFQIESVGQKLINGIRAELSSGELANDFVEVGDDV